MGNKMYFVYKILSESKQPISGEVILRYLECCGYSMNIKTVYRLIDRLNEFYFFLFWKANKTFIYNERVIFYYHYSLRLFIALKI